MPANISHSLLSASKQSTPSLVYQLVSRKRSMPTPYSFKNMYFIWSVISADMGRENLGVGGSPAPMV